MQFTAREVYGLLCCPEEVIIDINGRQYTVKKQGEKEHDEFVLEHFQNYIVEDISSYGDGCYVITLLVEPVVKEAAK